MTSGECIRCGGRTSGNNGRGMAPKLCRECYRSTGWTRERIIAAISQWADEHGGIPPTSLQWGQAGLYHPDWRPGEHPVARTVHRRLGGWNRALEAAGYEPHMPYDTDRYTDATVRGICARITNGETAAAISREMGLSDHAVSQALRDRGITIKSLRNAA